MAPTITDEMVEAALLAWYGNEHHAMVKDNAVPDMRAAIEAALAAAPQWIACEERLPEAGVEVLVWLADAAVIKYGCQIAIDTWDEQHETPVAWSSATIPIGEGWDSSADWQDITHWMPLPAAPRSER